MYYIKDIGYIIKRTDTKEADKVITILTRKNGKIDVLAKGVRKKESKRAAHVELLNKISFQAVSKGQNSRAVLTEVQLEETHAGLKSTLEYLKVLFLICELVSVLCPYKERQEDIFNLLNTTLSRLQKESYSSVLQSFQVKLLSSLGYWDPVRAFVDEDDINSFTENIMQKKLRSHTFFKT
jgi:DNA repair protein RecO (recombination protein O)